MAWKVRYYPVCMDCGQTHCCNPPSKVHDGSLRSMLGSRISSTESDTHVCDSNGPWPGGIGTQFIQARKKKV